MQQNNDDVQKIIDATDIVSLVSKYVTLTKQGKNYMGLCPFHNEDTPSFVVSPDKKIAHCFGCKGGGNAVNFMMQIESVGFTEAIAKLAEFNGMEYHGRAKKQANDPNERYYKIMRVATDFYKKNYSHTQRGLEAKEYLISRGLDEETIEAFQVGLSPKIGDTLYQVLKESDFLELDMADVSLVDKNEKAGYHDIFADRIMFPICDEKGRPIAFSARIFNSKDKNQPKYINSRESKIFIKGQTLFNIHLAKSDILKKNRVILHEGQMDVIASYRSNLKEAICTLGTGLTDYHAKLLHKYTDSVVICYDGDKAGIEASKKAIKTFKNNGFIVHLVLLPDGMDPDEYVLKYGKEAYHDYFENNLIDPNQYLFEVGTINKDYSDSNVVAQVKDDIFAIIQSMTQATEQEDYLHRFARILNTSIEALQLDFDSYRANHASVVSVDMYPTEPTYEDQNYFEPVPAPYVEPVPVKKEYPLCILRLFMYAKKSKDQALFINSMINDTFAVFPEDLRNLWIQLIDNYYENFDTFDDGRFMRLLNPEDANVFIQIYESLRGDPTKYDDNDMNSCIAKLPELLCNQNQQMLKEKMNRAQDVPDQTLVIEEMIKNRKLKENLKNNKRK